MKVHDLPTPALVIDRAALAHNLATMADTHPGASLRPHVKAHKCTALAAAQRAAGHAAFTCATPREVLGMAAAGLSDDLLLANEVLDPARLTSLAAAQDTARITIAVDSDGTVTAAARAGLRSVLVDVNVGLPRCGCRVEDAGRIADLARSHGMEVRGVMGYEGHVMMVEDRVQQRAKVAECMDRLLAAHALVGGDVISAGGTGTYDLHDRVTEVQAGSYALMDTHYARLGLPFRHACRVVGTVLSVSRDYAVADVGLKAMGMDHGNPTVRTLDDQELAVWFLSDEHVTFATNDSTTLRVGDRVNVLPAHIDPTMAMHEVAWLVDGDTNDGTVVEPWSIDLRGW